MKKTTFLLKLVSLVVCVVLIAAMGLMLTSCGKEDNGAEESSSTQSTQSLTSSGITDKYGSAITNVGEGDTVFIFRVTDKDGIDTLFRVHTNEKIVGDALQKQGLIEGEEGQYGLFVKKVNGITADYDVDKTYWAFYVDGEYAMSGVDTTEIEKDKEYCFKVEK